MDRHTAATLARTTSSTEIAAQRAAFASLLSDADHNERASLLDAIATLDEAARLEGAEAHPGRAGRAVTSPKTEITPGPLGP